MEVYLTGSLYVFSERCITTNTVNSNTNNYGRNKFSKTEERTRCGLNPEKVQRYARQEIGRIPYERDECRPEQRSAPEGGRK